MEKPQEFGDTFSCIKVYLGKLNGEYLTVEKFLDGTTQFSKYVNNIGDIYLDENEVSMKEETWKTQCRLKGCEWCTVLFCPGNLSYSAIEKFKEVQVRNQYCTLLKLDQE